MYYIQRKDNIRVETIDSFEVHADAKHAVKEYRLSDNNAQYYISTRKTR